MPTNILSIPNDILHYVIPEYLTYYYFNNIRLSNKIFYQLDLYYYNKKCNKIKYFFKKYMYNLFSDLKGYNRKGHLVNLETIINNKYKYTGEKIQLICAFQYDHRYIETGSIVEGKLILLQDAWVINDEYYSKIHPFLIPFILKKSIRILNS